MMSCSSTKMTKKRIAVFSAIGAGTATILYVAFATHNPSLAALAPTFLTLALCPVMCAVIGGAMWFSNKFAKKKN